MKALSIQQPWAELILRGLKDVENRSWFTHYTGPLLIHASRTTNADAADAFARYGLPDDLPCGELVGMVDLVQCTKRLTSPSHKRGRWGWYLARPRRFGRPIRYTASVGLMEVPNRLIASAVRWARSERALPLDPSPGNAGVPRVLHAFTWGYEGWGNATRQLIRAVDLAEARHGFAPPLFADVRLRRSVRAIGFRERAFERLLGHERYRWMPALGNPQIKNRRARGRVACPTAAHQLLDLVLDAARERRRVIIFCSCPSPFPDCHRHDVAKCLDRVAKLRGPRIMIEEWPGGQPSRWALPVHVTKSAIQAVRSGRGSVLLPPSTPLQTLAGLPWGTLVELSAGKERHLLRTGPAQYQRRRWVLPVRSEAD